MTFYVLWPFQYFSVARLCKILLLLWGGLWFCSSEALAATVTQKRKKRKVIVIDEGRNSGVQQGDSVCFYDLDDEEVGCGKVRRVQANRSFVRVKTPVFRKVRQGFVASYGDGGGSGSSGGSSGAVVRFRLLGGGSFTQPYAATLPDYKQSKAPYWGDSENSLGLFKSGHAGIEIEAADIYLSAGFRYDFFAQKYEGEQNYSHNSKVIECNKGSNDKNFPCYVYWDYKPSTLGGWLQFLYPLPLTDDISWSLGIGADFDYSTLQITAEQRKDNSNSKTVLLEDVESTLFSVGVRIVPASLTMEMSEMFSVFITNALVIGVFGEASISDFNSKDRNLGSSTDATKDKKDYVQKYFAEALDHSPGFGVMLYGGIQLSF